MSYDIDLCEPDGRVCQFSERRQVVGGTYAVGGSTDVSLNVTYNYHPQFAVAFEDDQGIKILEGMLASESLPLLVSAFNRLDGKPDDDYWADTPGNAKEALRILIGMASEFTYGRWRIH